MAITVANLIDAAQGVADKRNDQSISPTDWLRYVNWGVKSLDNFIAALDPAFRFAQADFTLVSTAAGSRKNLSTVTWLDEDLTPFGYTPTFAALHGIDANPDTPQRRTVTRRNFRERNRGQAIGWWVPTVPAPRLRYDMRGRTVVVSPYEAAAGSYRAYARLRAYLFTSPTDVIPIDYQLEPYDEFVTDMAARRALNIEESDTSFNSGRLAEVKDEIRAEHTRDDGEATVIADVEDFDYGD